jgi:hypothetical protein
MTGMKIPRRTAAHIAGWSVAAVLGAGAVTGVSVAFASGPQTDPQAAAAYTDAPSGAPSPSGSAGSTDAPDKGAGPDGRHGPGRGGFPRGRGDGVGLGHGIGGGALHGEFTVKDKDDKIVTRVVQHGSVTAVSATSISLKSEDGFTGTYAVNADTKVRLGGDNGAISGVKTGNDAWVIATRSGSTSTAGSLVVRTK